MQFPVNVPDFEGRELVYEVAGVLSAGSLLLDGVPAPKGPKRGQFLLRRADGTDALAQFKAGNFFDPIPQIVVEGVTFVIAPPLKWYQWLWGGLPFLLIITGGAIGGLFGGLAFGVNGRVFRSKLSGAAQYLVTILVSVLALVATLISVSLFGVLMRSFTPAASEFTSQTGGFSVMTPYTLKESSQSVDTAVGKIDIHFFIAEQGGESYLVGYSDYPEAMAQASDPEKMLDSGRDGAVKNVNGTLVSEARITLDGHPGRELTIAAKAGNGQDLVLRGRIVLVGNRLYQVVTVALKGNENSSRIEDFLKSFKLLAK